MHSTACAILLQVVDALKLLGAGTQAEAELRRLERPAKRAREAEVATAAAPAKQPKQDPSSAQGQAFKQEPTAAAPAATAVANGIKQEPAVARPEGAAAAPLQADGPGNQQRYQQLQQHAAQHQQQQAAKPLRQVC